MVRAPCCEKTGLNKGPWTAEEDRILIDYINQNGHGNWRALPVRAGLLRCGKSCRLRWMNYLRPDIKRGNFTWEEEETIIKLHNQLGNKWSVIAARLPGRTDNEIKNVWNTHLKKRLTGEAPPKSKTKFESEEKFSEPDSPMQSFSETTSATADSGGSGDFTVNMMTELESLTEMGESFWSEVFSGEDWTGSSDIPAGNSDNSQLVSNFDEEMAMGNHFWTNVFYDAGESTDLSHFL